MHTLTMKTCHFIQCHDEKRPYQNQRLIHAHLFFCHVIALTKSERLRCQFYNLRTVLISPLYQIFLFYFTTTRQLSFLLAPFGLLMFTTD